jgi:hypothetical protein
MRANIALLSGALILSLVLASFIFVQPPIVAPLGVGAITAAILAIAAIAVYLFLRRADQDMDRASLSRQYYDKAEQLRRRAAAAPDAQSRRDLMLLAIKSEVIGDEFSRLEQESDDD